MRYLPDARFGFIMILRILMQFKLSSCFATHSESVAIAVVLVVDCPNPDRLLAFIPPLHPSSITLAAPFPLRPFPHPQYSLFLPISLQYTLQWKSSTVYQSFLASLEGTNNFFFRDRQKERKGNTRLDSTRIEPATCPGQGTGRYCLFACCGGVRVLGGILFIY